MGILPLFIPIRHLAQGNFLKNLQPTCGDHSPMCAHVHPCAPMCGPCVNYEQTKTQLKWTKI